MPDDEAPDAPELMHRELRDPDVLRALAHPVRLQLLEELAVQGPANATELAKRVGESQANCSWHLRQLHRYGFIEEVPEAKGRQRPWRYVVQRMSFSDEHEQPGSAFSLVTESVRNLMIDREVAILKQWQSAQRPESPWRSTGETTQSIMYLTREELEAFNRDLDELVTRHFASRHERIDTGKRPPGSRLVRFVSWAVAGGADTETPERAEGPDHPEDET